MAAYTLLAPSYTAQAGDHPDFTGTFYWNNEEYNVNENAFTTFMEALYADTTPVYGFAGNYTANNVTNNKGVTLTSNVLTIAWNATAERFEASSTTTAATSLGINTKLTNNADFTVGSGVSLYGISATTAANIVNSGTFHVDSDAIVNGIFSGIGTINLKDNTIDGLTIKRGLEADGYNTVKFAGTATMVLNDTTIEAGTVEVNAQNVKLQSDNIIDATNLSFLSTKYIYVEGENNTIIAPEATDGKFIVLRNGGELVDSTVLGAQVKMDDGDYYKTVAQNATISGTGEYTSIFVRTSSQANADVVNQLTIKDTGAEDDFVFVRKELYVGLNNQSGKLVLDNAKVSVVDPDANVDAAFTVRGPISGNNLGATADLKNVSLLTAEQAIIYYGCTVNVELGSMFQAGSIGIAAGTNAGGTINIDVDSNDLDKTERYTLVDAGSIDPTIALKVSVDDADPVAIVDGMKFVTVGTGQDAVDYYITTLNHSGVYITSDSQETLYVSSDYATLPNGTFVDAGYLVGYNAFSSVVDALKEVNGIDADTTNVRINVEEVTPITGQDMLFYGAGKAAAFNKNTTITATDPTTVTIGFNGESTDPSNDGDNGLMLMAADGKTFIIDTNVTLRTTFNGTGDPTEDTGSVYLNYFTGTRPSATSEQEDISRAHGDLTVKGDIIAAGDIKFFGTATVTGDLTASGASVVPPASTATEAEKAAFINNVIHSGEDDKRLIVLAAGRANAAGAEQNETAIIGDANSTPELTAAWFDFVSGDANITNATVNAQAFIYTNTMGEPGDTSRVAAEEYAGNKATLTSTNTTWDVDYFEAYRDLRDGVSGVLTFNGGEVNVNAAAGRHIGTNNEYAAEIGAPVTVNLTAAAFSVANGTLKNAGNIYLNRIDTTHTASLSVKELVNSGMIDSQRDNVIEVGTTDAQENFVGGNVTNTGYIYLVRSTFKAGTVDNTNGYIEVRGSNGNNISIANLTGIIDFAQKSGTTSVTNVYANITGGTVRITNEVAVSGTIDSIIDNSSTTGTLSINSLKKATINNSVIDKSGAEPVKVENPNAITVSGTLEDVTVNDGTITSTAGFTFAGSSSLNDVDVTVTGENILTNTGVLTVDAASLITANQITLVGENAKILISGTGLVEGTVKKVIDQADTAAAANDKIQLTDAAKTAGYDLIYNRGDYYITKLGDIAKTIKVDETWQAVPYGTEIPENTGYYSGINAFGNVADALTAAYALKAGVDTATTPVTIDITSSYYDEDLKQDNLGYGSVFSNNILLKGKTTDPASVTIVTIPFKNGDYGLFLNPAGSVAADNDNNIEAVAAKNVTVDSTLKIKTIGTANVDSGSVYLNYTGTDGSVTVYGAIEAAHDIKIYGETTINGSLTAGAASFLYLRSAKAGANKTVAINGTVDAGQMFYLSSGKVTAANGATITANGFMFTQLMNSNKAAGNPERYLPAGEVASLENPVTLISNDSSWTFKKDFSTATIEPEDAQSYGVFTFNGGLVSVEGQNVITATWDDAAAGEVKITDKVTLNLNGTDMIVGTKPTTENENTDLAGSVTNEGKINLAARTVETTENNEPVSVTKGATLDVNGAVENKADAVLAIGGVSIDEQTGAASATDTVGSTLTAASLTNAGTIYVATASNATTKSSLTVAGDIDNKNGAVNLIGGSLEVTKTNGLIAGANGNRGTIRLENATLNADVEWTTVTVSGTSKLENYRSFYQGVLTFENNAVLQNSFIGNRGEINVANEITAKISNSTFREKVGNNNSSWIVNSGTLTLEDVDNVGAITNAGTLNVTTTGSDPYTTTTGNIANTGSINATGVSLATGTITNDDTDASISAKNLTAGTTVANVFTGSAIENSGAITASGDIKAGDITNGTETVTTASISAASIDAGEVTNSGEITATAALTTGAITNGTETVTNASISAASIDADGAIENYGSISATGAIEASAINNSGTIAGAKSGNEYGYAGNIVATGAITNSGLIKAAALSQTGNVSIENEAEGEIMISGTLTGASVSTVNYGMIEAGSFDGAGYIENGTETVKNASISATNGSIDARAITKNYGSISATNGNVVAAEAITNYGSISATDNASTTVVEGNVTVAGAITNGTETVTTASISAKNLTAGTTVANVFTGSAIENSGAITASGDIKAGDITNSGSITVSGTLSADSFTNNENATLSLVAKASTAAMTVTGAYTNAGTITIDASGLLNLAPDTATQIISINGAGAIAAGNIQIGGTGVNPDNFQVMIDEHDGKKGIWLYKNSGEPVNMETVVVNRGWSELNYGDDVIFGEDSEGKAIHYRFGINAFDLADEFSLTADTETLKFATSLNPYHSLSLEHSVDVTVWNQTGLLPGGKITLSSLTIGPAADADEDEDLVVTMNGEIKVTGAATIEDANVNIDGGDITFGSLEVTNSRVNIGEKNKANTTEINGTVTITGSDVDFDNAVTTIGGNVEIEGSEVEFDFGVAIDGSLTIDANSTVEADQGFEFTAGGATVDGKLRVSNKDDKNPEGNTSSNLGALDGSGMIEIGWDSPLTFTGVAYTGKLDVDVSGYGDYTKAYAGKTATVVYNAAGTKEKYAAWLATDSTEAGFAAGKAKLAKYFKIVGGNLMMNTDAKLVWELTDDTDLRTFIDAKRWTGDDSTKVGDDALQYVADFVVINSGATYVSDTGAVEHNPKGIYFDMNKGQTVVVKNATFSQAVFGGHYVDTYTGDDLSPEYIGNGDLNLIIEGGKFNKAVVGGDRIDHDGYYYHKGNCSVTINDGTFNALVAAGMMYNLTSVGSRVLVDSTNLTIAGGTFASSKFVYGGNVALKKAASAAPMVRGNTDVTIKVGDEAESKLTLNNLIVGSYGDGVVKGNTQLTLTGNVNGEGAKAHSIESIWGGCSSDVMADVNADTREYRGYVNGDRILTFEGFNGALNCNQIGAFSKVQVNGGSDVTLSNAAGVRLDDVSDWEFEFGSTLVGDFKNDFAKAAQLNDLDKEGDTLWLNLADADWTAPAYEKGWTLFSGMSQEAVDSFAGFYSVTGNTDDDLTTAELTFALNSSEDAWIATDADANYKYTLSKGTDSMVLTRATLA